MLKKSRVVPIAGLVLAQLVVQSVMNTPSAHAAGAEVAVWQGYTSPSGSYPAPYHLHVDIDLACLRQLRASGTTCSNDNMALRPHGPIFIDGGTLNVPQWDYAIPLNWSTSWPYDAVYSAPYKFGPLADGTATLTAYENDYSTGYTYVELPIWASSGGSAYQACVTGCGTTFTVTGLGFNGLSVSPSTFARGQEARVGWGPSEDASVSVLVRSRRTGKIVRRAGSWSEVGGHLWLWRYYSWKWKGRKDNGAYARPGYYDIFVRGVAPDETTKQLVGSVHWTG